MAWLDRLRQIEKPVGVVCRKQMQLQNGENRNAAQRVDRNAPALHASDSRAIQARRIEANYERRVLRGTRMADAFAQSRIDSSRAAFTKRAGSVASSSMRTS